MSARMHIAHLTLLIAVTGLGACASTPVPASAPQDSAEPIAHFDPAKDPYWRDPRWDKSLLDTVQAAVHDPVDPTGTATPGLHATVKFALLNGVIEYPEITESSGDPDLDKLMLHQVAAVQVPKPTGLQTDQPHEFELDLEMPTAFESFQDSIFTAIDSWKIYPKNAVMGGAQGITAVEFDYADGKTTGISMTKSSHSKILDQASIDTVTKAIMPSAPATYVGKSFHIEVLFCYALYQSDNDKKRCPGGRNVILVTGTRIR